MNAELLKQIEQHLSDVMMLAAMIKRKPASDDDWAVDRARTLVAETGLIFRSIGRSRCGSSSQDSSSGQ